MRRLFLLLATLLLCLPLQAQEDSVRVLPPLEISDSRLTSFAAGEKISRIKERLIGGLEQHNLAHLLMRYSSLNVRSYGLSGLSTASLRGSGSNHTPVFWEGINLQSSMNGTLDLALIPVSFTDHLSLQYGSAGSLFGAGTLGGAIHLSSRDAVPDEPAFRFYQQAGSFGRYYSGLNAAWGNARVGGRLRLFRQQAENNFPYYNIYRRREERRQHAAVSQQGLLSETFWKPGNGHQLSLKYWLQENQTEIAANAAAGNPGQAIQDDDFHRAVLTWEMQEGKHQFKARTALLTHRLLYEDERLPPALSRTLSWISEAEQTLYLSDEHWLFLGLNHTRESAEADNLGSVEKRERTAAFLSFRSLLFNRLTARLGVRQVLMDGELAPTLPSLGLSLPITDGLELRAKVGRSFNLPTFNDLYWQGASRGNPNLRPEKGWSSEMGVEFQHPFSEELKLSSSLTLFSNLVDNWIQWVPRSRGWSPLNVQQVWARGLEWDAELAYRPAADWDLKLWIHYNLARSTKEAIYEGGNRAELHKQLIYVPRQQAKSSLRLLHGQWEGALSAHFIGQQFTTAANRRSLPAYLLADVSLGRRFVPAAGHKLQLFINVNNIGNTTYMVREGFPMPGRYFELSLNYHFKP